MNHPGEIAALDPAGAAAYRGHHDGRAGASRVLSLGRGDRRRKGGSLPRAWSRAVSRSSTATTRITRVWLRRRSAPGPPKLSALEVIPRRRRGCWTAVLEPDGSTVRADDLRLDLRFRLSVPGRHWVINALAVLAAAQAAGADLGRAAEALAELEALPGRGRRRELAWRGGTLTLIDESYNASPAAMRAALAVLGDTEPGDGGRRIAVLGDMLELGDSPSGCIANSPSRSPPPKSTASSSSARRWRRFSSPSRRETRRVVAIGRGGCPCPARLPRTRRCRDGQRLPRCRASATSSSRLCAEAGRRKV